MKGVFFFLLVMLMPLTARAAFDVESFARLPVLQDGRIKPLDSLARAALLQLSGGQGQPASAWLAQVLFDPDSARQQTVFQVRNATVPGVLGLPPRPEKFYNFDEIGVALDAHKDILQSLRGKDSNAMTPEQREIARLAANADLFMQLRWSMALLQPFTGEQGQSYLDLLKQRPALLDAVRKTMALKQNNLKIYSPAEEHRAELSWRLDMLSRIGRANTMLRVIPPLWDGQTEWLSPWGVIENGQGSPAGQGLFRQWRRLSDAYLAGNAAASQEAATAIFKADAITPGMRPWALRLEVFYNRADLLGKGLVLYILGAGLMGIAYFKSGAWERAAFAATGLGAALHLAVLVMRMMILARPPVSTLYESMIFVAFVAAAAGLALQHRRPEADGLMIGSVIAALLLVTARGFADGDTLEVLVAVLNTNFWLATHVVCITAGYGATLVAGTMAHLYLLRRTSEKNDSGLFALDRALRWMTVVALLLTTVGTMLGGIWADQSWGRFWGWDPKENGALWIVLWLAWALHGRAGRKLNAFGFAVCLAPVNIVVALAWVGVNLLSVGLHSYGFSDAAATGLMAFCGGEVCLIGVLALAGRRRKHAG